jgi:UDP-N-acetylmuramoyl-tripeptide--D-alanyl-D-alanine ligase
MKLYAKEIASAIGGEIIGGDVEINSISTNSREIGKNCLFIPLKGEKFDGHRFIETAVQNGAACILTQEDGAYTVPSIRVENTHDAMGALAKYYRQKFDIPFVGLTGSVGKTTTKDMIANVLAQKYNVLKTEGNFNNDIGVPLTLFRLEDSHECAVIEMGMNHFNEISYLTNIVCPDIAVITNVGVSHIENLGSREGILKAKCEIFESMKPDSPKILNGDNDMLISVKDKYENIVYFGTENTDFPVYADNIEENGIEGIDCIIHYGIDVVPVSIPLPGRHNVSNALSAAAVGFKLGLDAVQIKNGIESFKPTGGRMDIVKTDRYTIINDVYNANPASVEAGIDVLSKAKGKTCCVLGDMLELGDYAKSLHSEVGEYAVDKGIDVLVCIGELSENMYKAAIVKRAIDVYYFASVDEFKEKAESLIEVGMTVLVKASRGMHFERIVDYLRDFK